MRIGVNQVISRKRTQLESCRSEFKSDLLRSCDKQKEHLTRFREKLTLSTAVILERQGRQIEHLANMCHLLDPQRILQRGYAIARINNKVIDANNVPEQAGIISIETSELIVLAEHLSTNKKEKS
jgi:exonuclease VII large subunit